MMKPSNKSQNKILLAIPSYNEAATITNVINRVRGSMPGYDLLVINDGSHDATGQILSELKVVTATHLCNLGYGRAIQTAIKYALQNGYEVLITLDADGQHHPEQIQMMTEEFLQNHWDCLVGSRYIKLKSYKEAPLGRRIGMQLFSLLTVHALAFVAVLLVMAPWVYRNYRVFHAIIPATTFGGGVLWQGNNPEATGLPSDGGFQPHAEVTDEVLRDALARKEAMAFIKEKPKRFARLFFARLYRTYEVDVEVAQSSLNAGRPLPAILSGGFIKICNTFFNAIMLLFCVYLIFPLFRISDFSLRSWCIVMIPTAYFALMQAVFLAQDRYKYPTVPFIAIGVAVVLSKLQIVVTALWQHSRFSKVPSSEPKFEPVA
ncbi:MAG: glycosyltransferase family 2 protein [Acidobacteria bacterium]|nr:glycosyltransferase family 2 protein [Acidobacteriota bacterium]